MNANYGNWRKAALTNMYPDEGNVVTQRTYIDKWKEARRSKKHSLFVPIGRPPVLSTSSGWPSIPLENAPDGTRSL